MFNNNRETAVGFLSAFKDLTLRELWTNRRIRKAFEEVLDNPEAVAALQQSGVGATPRGGGRLNRREGGTSYPRRKGNARRGGRGAGPSPRVAGTGRPWGPTSDNCCAIT